MPKTRCPACGVYMKLMDATFRHYQCPTCGQWAKETAIHGTPVLMWHTARWWELLPLYVFTAMGGVLLGILIGRSVLRWL